MTDPPDLSPTILVVDDERDLADLYEVWLSEEYRVRTAYGGEEALDVCDNAVDVVLLDRRMPDLSGDEVLERLRDQGNDCQVVMVTAVDPDFDILGMGFDDYVTKPVDRTELHTLVERMVTRREYDAQLRSYYRLVEQSAALVTEKSEDELAASPGFADLEARIADLEAEMDLAVGDFEEGDFEAAFRDLDDP
ncbi:response regulator [Haloplanus sp.]|uniref:response regulator n=1 Tax=Haloplanus sp. TaxID=1961696 RepID=UPI0026292580|nr:response regulator [Haloplanus sp.]